MKPEYKPFVDELIELCIKEDIGDGDHTSLACIPADEHGRMRLLCKQEGVIAGIEIAQLVLKRLDPEMHYRAQIYADGEKADWKTNPYDVAISERRVAASDSLQIRMASGGGCAIRFVPEPEK